MRKNETVIISALLSAILFSGCATTGKALFGIPTDHRMEAYKQYAATVDESVASGKISELDGETLKYNALQQVQRDNADERSQQAAAFGALYGGMAQMQQARAAQAMAERPIVSGSLQQSNYGNRTGHKIGNTTYYNDGTSETVW